MVTRTELANAIRFLSMDAVEKAKSGHPGAPMGMADIAEVLWRDHLKHNPANPNWPDRDRFVLSNGHGSMLIYSLLHLSGYDLSIEDLKQFRQLHSKTPGHPEYGYAPGIETTTGPLGQGITNAVGMALAEKMLAAQFNRDGHQIVDHHTYAFLGDGCLMEGISHEACSLAGTWGLNKLIAFWDDNGISIDGHVEGWFTDDTPARFEAYGWQVIKNVNGHDPVEVATAIATATAQKEGARPTLICCKTTIGFGAPTKQGSHDCHGSPLGAAEIAAAREGLNWPHAPFEIPAEIYAEWSARDKGALAEIEWNKRFDAYRAAFPELAAEFSRRMSGELPAGWEEAKAAALAKIADAAQTVATRKASQIALEALSPVLPEFVGGSADLSGSNLTNWSGSKWIDHDGQGNYISYGVREFGMAAIMNGMTLHGGLRPYGGTFLMFSEYARNALRMASLMKINPIFVFTHDSIGLGEDGPTHQPVEQVATLRYIPNHHTWRPCDTAETAAAWAHAVEQKTTPSSMVLSRQNLPFVARDAAQLAAIQKGGYVLRDAAGARAVLIATGSEVELALKAQDALAAEGIAVRVVSMPCTNVFDRQDKAWRDSVLPAGLPRLAIEAGHPDFWRKYVGLDGDVVGIDHFGESAPAPQLFQAFGFTVDNVVAKTKALL
ncbi:transketolase [Chromobacterium aquaticum]|uniref:Transketolase n=1 Tax=Chromobacterium aquaticum TaxID=467180 RepID=A0ABV8ZQK9_9NEIS|nr:transketolase [Chromobacterium aquaticum]MCD5360769.1 transketolase [Chromobacterium aquaticum]